MITDRVRDARALTVAAAIARRESALLDVTCLGVMPFALLAMDPAPLILEPDPSKAIQHADALAAWVGFVVSADLRITVETATVLTFSLVEAVAQTARFSDLLGLVDV